GLAIVDGRAVPLTLLHLSEIGEPESAGSVEDKIVGPTQTMTVAFGIDYLDFAARDVHPLNTTARVPLRQPLYRMAVGGQPEAAIVTDVDLAVGPDRCAVGAAAGLGYDLFGAIGSHTGERATRDFHDQHATVCHCDRAFGEQES